MLLARKLTPAEIRWSQRNMAVCFEGDFDWDKAAEEAPSAAEDPKAEHWGAFFPGEETPGASLVMNLFSARFDGHSVPMAGVGGVATLPPYRRGGAIRSLFQASLKDLRSQGYVLSALYPFSTAFYRQFGYENGPLFHRLTLPLRDLRSLPNVGGRVRQLFPGDSLDPLLQVYNACYESCNLSVVRTVYDPDLDLKKLFAQRRSIFLWEDEQGTPGAFLIGGRDGDVLSCNPLFSGRNALLFRDARALTGLLKFVATAFIANFDAIRFSVPAHIPVFDLLPEAASMQCTTLHDGMLRVVNVEKALELCACRQEGCVTLQVEDSTLPENTGTYRVSFHPGGPNRVQRVDDPPQILLPVGAFSALLLGVHAAEDLPWLPGVQVFRSEGLEALFYRKPCYVLDLF